MASSKIIFTWETQLCITITLFSTSNFPSTIKEKYLFDFNELLFSLAEKGQQFFYTRAGADPGFPLGGGRQPTRRGTNLQFCQNFPKKLHEIAKMLGHRGHAPGASLLDPPLPYKWKQYQVGE